MDDIEKLQQKEIEKLSEEEEILELEDLITSGTDYRIPIIIDYPTEDGTIKQVTARLKPLTSTEWNNATRLGLKNKNTTPDIEIVKKSLYSKNDEPINPKFIENLHAGVIEGLVKETARISGIHISEQETQKVAKELMGF